MPVKQQENKQRISAEMHESAQINEAVQISEHSHIHQLPLMQRSTRQSLSRQPALQHSVQQPSSKECPVCHARCFSDMDVCYGCLYQFPSAANNRYTPGASGSALAAAQQISASEVQPPASGPTNQAPYQEIHKAYLSPQEHEAAEQPTATFKRALPSNNNNACSPSLISTADPQSEISAISSVAPANQAAVQNFQTVKEIPLFENNSLEMRIVIQVRQNGHQNGHQNGQEQ